MTKKEICEKNFWCQGSSVVTRCKKCGFHFHVGIGYQYKQKKLIPVKCIKCGEIEAVPVLKDHITIAAI